MIRLFFTHHASGNNATTPEKLLILRQFSMETLRAVAEKHKMLLARSSTLEGVVEATAIIEVEAPSYPPHTSFEDIFADAMCWRPRSILSFFHRRNPECVRTLKPSFALSPDFSEKFEAVVRAHIVPAMMKSRTVSIVGSSWKWNPATSTAVDLWSFIENDPNSAERIRQSWNGAWEALYQRKVTKKVGNETKEVLVASKELQSLRPLLESDLYDLPTVRNRELDLFRSLLFEYDTLVLERSWVKVRQIYEQEMDRRSYQDKAREGALRDSLLEVFDRLSDRAGEFLVMLAYFAFPNIDVAFLEKFTHNKGRNHADREDRVPYLMRFLNQDGVAEVKLLESNLRRAREEAAKAAIIANR
ncbi:hypothetical protein amb3330 [Paramagnetospirillum magneticum AMB-1]|uniref:Uncharacterized protein n=2 Tax=Paramagnetospirillum magneticum TaxID=84159 RepID=Q2W1Z1_PARM1|nr:hypothetical protein amb3330 [Paramagnetospirillum magneticum AMB-1]